jgi:exopolysaccharide biosynthesis WecB/TagA/CpsF family protein
MSAGIALVCGVPVEDVTLDEAAERVTQLVERGRANGHSHQVVTVNTDFLVNSLADPRLRALLQTADLAIPDGMPVVWGSRMLGAPLRERVAGADLVPEIARRCAAVGHSMYLLGGGEGVAAHAAEVLRRRHVGLSVSGESGGQFARPEDMDPQVLARLQEFRPDVLCVALGHPKQEHWIATYRQRLRVPVMIGVGGSLDFLTGVQRRAPRWMQRSGTEWLHRTFSEPGRFVPRYTRDFVRFVPQLVREAVQSRPRPERYATAVGAHFGARRNKVGRQGRLRLDGTALGWDHQDSAGSCPGQAVVVDIRGRTFLDQQELAELVVLAKRLALDGRELILTSVSESVMRQLLQRRLYGFLRVSSHPVPTGDGADESPDGWLPPSMRAGAHEKRRTYA